MTSLSVLLISVFLSSALFGIQLISVASAEGPYDWPTFRHDLTHSGYSESPAPNTNQTLWTYTASGGFAGSPAIVDDRVYVGSWSGTFYCLDATRGAQIWNYTTGDQANSSPAVADGKVYAGSSDYNVYCWDAVTGALIWNYTTGDSVISSPAVVDGKVYIGSFDDNVYCLDATTGALVWNYTTGGDIYASSPAIADGKVYIGSEDTNFYCLDATTGGLIWNYTTGGTDCGMPAVANGKVYQASGTSNNFYCLNATTGAQIWNYTVGSNANNVAIAYNNMYGTSHDDNIYCLDATTGAQIWNYTTGADVISPPSVADGKVYAGCFDSNVYCLNSKTGDLVWSYTTGSTIFYSSPAIANGELYVPSGDGSVYAFGAESPLSGAAWSKTYGGTGEDLGQGETVQTSDGGYTISGDTNSSGAGGMDFWLIKTDANGNMLWNQTYGGPLDESALDMCQTSDGGYAISGSTYSFGAGGQDVWLVKTDADGNMLWNQTYGGTGDDFGHPVIQTSDGGYLISGTTDSFGAGGQDAWLIKTDADGNMLWNQTYGGPSVDQGYSVVQTGDGGYTLVVITDSFGAGSSDTWLIKADADGNMLWNQTYGGTGIDIGFSLIQSSDGGYAMAGFTTSFGGYKIYLVKADANGTMQWNQTYQISAADIGIHGIQTADGGYAIVGWIYQNGQDFALYKTNATGDLEWTRSYGGTGLDNGYALLQDSDGGYVLTGNTNSSGAGGTDIWLVKVDEFGVIPESFTITIVVLLSTVSVAVSVWLLRKRPKLKNSLLEKP